jgi:hypothetical protein
MPDRAFPITWNLRKCLSNQGSWNYTKFSKLSKNKKQPLVILGKNVSNQFHCIDRPRGMNGVLWGILWGILGRLPIGQRATTSTPC